MRLSEVINNSFPSFIDHQILIYGLPDEANFMDYLQMEVRGYQENEFDETDDDLDSSDIEETMVDKEKAQSFYIALFDLMQLAEWEVSSFTQMQKLELQSALKVIKSEFRFRARIELTEMQELESKILISPNDPDLIFDRDLCRQMAGDYNSFILSIDKIARQIGFALDGRGFPEQ